jgi:hypothetical protein
MGAATFKIKVLPKRMATKGEAANYCGRRMPFINGLMSSAKQSTSVK